MRNELADLAKNINIGERTLIKSVENSPKEKTIINHNLNYIKKLPPINPYLKNKHFIDLKYHNSRLNSTRNNNLQNSFSSISGNNKNFSYSINNLAPLNRNLRIQRIGNILKRPKLSLDNSGVLSEIFPINSTKHNKSIIFDKNKSQDIYSIDTYNSVKKETMANYRHETLLKDMDDDDAKSKGNNNNSRISSVFHNSQSRPMSHNINDVSVIHVNIKEKSFINPHESMDIINTNRFIYDNISGSLHDIQKIYYDKTIKSIEYYNKWKKKNKKIRVSTLVPKNFELLGLNKQGSVISEAVNEDPDKEKEEEEDLFEEFREDFLEKKKEKEKEKQKKLQQKKDKEEMKMLRNRVMKLDDYQLFASYKYSSKNFPEGREQFSFRYNLVDIVLFGGLVMNKANNHVWTLDPSKLLMRIYFEIFLFSQ